MNTHVSVENGSNAKSVIRRFVFLLLGIPYSRLYVIIDIITVLRIDSLHSDIKYRFRKPSLIESRDIVIIILGILKRKMKI